MTRRPILVRQCRQGLMTHASHADVLMTVVLLANGAFILCNKFGNLEKLVATVNDVKEDTSTRIRRASPA